MQNSPQLTEIDQMQRSANIPEYIIRGLTKSYKECQFGDENDLEYIPRQKRGSYKLLSERIDEKVIVM